MRFNHLLQNCPFFIVPVSFNREPRLPHPSDLPLPRHLSSCLLWIKYISLREKKYTRGPFLFGMPSPHLSVFLLSGSILQRLAGTGMFLLFSGASSTGQRFGRAGNPLTLLNRNHHFLLFPLVSLFSPCLVCIGELSLGFSRTVSQLAGIPLLFSSTFMGLPITFIFLIFILLAFLCSGKQKPFFLYCSLVSLIALTSFYLMLMAYFPFLWEKPHEAF